MAVYGKYSLTYAGARAKDFFFALARDGRGQSIAIYMGFLSVNIVLEWENREMTR